MKENRYFNGAKKAAYFINDIGFPSILRTTRKLKKGLYYMNDIALPPLVRTSRKIGHRYIHGRK